MMMMDKGRVYLTLIGTENVIDEGKLNYCKKSTIASSDEEVFNSLSPSIAELIALEISSMIRSAEIVAIFDLHRKVRLLSCYIAQTRFLSGYSRGLVARQSFDPPLITEFFQLELRQIFRGSKRDIEYEQDLCSRLFWFYGSNGYTP